MQCRPAGPNRDENIPGTGSAGRHLLVKPFCSAPQADTPTTSPGTRRARSHSIKAKGRTGNQAAEPQLKLATQMPHVIGRAVQFDALEDVRIGRTGRVSSANFLALAGISGSLPGPHWVVRRRSVAVLLSSDIAQAFPSREEPLRWVPKVTIETQPTPVQ
jgi:hypothetical protein